MNGLTVVVLAVGMVGWALLGVVAVGAVAGQLLAYRFPRKATRDTDEPGHASQ